MVDRARKYTNHQGREHSRSKIPKKSCIIFKILLTLSCDRTYNKSTARAQGNRNSTERNRNGTLQNSYQPSNPHDRLPS